MNELQLELPYVIQVNNLHLIIVHLVKIKKLVVQRVIIQKNLKVLYKVIVNLVLLDFIDQLCNSI